MINPEPHSYSTHSHSSILRQSPVQITASSIRNYPLGVLMGNACKDFPEDEKVVNNLAKLANQIINDPVAIRQLSERVLELFRLDIQQHRERGQQKRSW